MLVLPLLALLCGLVAPAARAEPRHPRLRDVRTFALALGVDPARPAVRARLAAYDLVVIDGELARRRDVRALEAGGAVVLAYLSVGTIERHRSWYPLLRPYRLDRWARWDEWYAAVARRGFRDAISGRIAPAILAKGFDGLFLDNVDMVESHPRQRAGMRALVRRLDRLVGDGVVMAQNGDGAVRGIVGGLDAWNREDVTWTYDAGRRRYARVPAAAHREAVGWLARYRALGLLVTATDYTARGAAIAVAESAAAACAVGALPFAADIRLTRLPASPRACAPA